MEFQINVNAHRMTAEANAGSLSLVQDYSFASLIITLPVVTQPAKIIKLNDKKKG